MDQDPQKRDEVLCQALEEATSFLKEEVIWVPYLQNWERRGCFTQSSMIIRQLHN